MRRATYSAKKVYLPKASRIGYGLMFAKPGNWITWDTGGVHHVGRVLGRIDESDRDGVDCKGFLCAMALSDDMHAAFARWVDPAEVTYCRAEPPRALLAWIVGADWAVRGPDVARYLAMDSYGTTREPYIEARNEADKPWNGSPEYLKQFEL